MRIGLDARYVYDHFPGIGRYVANLAYALAEIDHGHTLVVLHNPALPNSRHSLAGLGELPGVELAGAPIRPFSLAEQLRAPRLARALRLDVLHSPYYIKPYIGLPCPSVVTIYDLIGLVLPDTLPPRTRLLFRLAMGLAVRRSQKIITISRSARDDLARSYGIAPAAIAVTPLAADQRFAPRPPAAVAALRERYGLPPRYVLYLGANKPHKNLARLVRAWERLHQISGWREERDGQGPAPPARPALVLAGHYDPRYPEARRMVMERGLAGSVRFIPNVAEDDLPALYSGAEVFVFPSYYEGFGLPPLEAMACGAPVLCAHASSLPEVVGAAALTFDPFSPDEMADGLRRLLSDPALRDRLREAGLRRSREFSWRRTAIETLQVYESVARKRLGG